MNARARLEAVPLIVIAISGSPAISRDPPPAKKLIELGWDIPPTSHLRESWEEIDRSAPFDGLMFRVEAKDDEGRLLSSESAWDARLWKREWLQGALDDLRSCRFRRLTSNFVRLNATPGTLDWADDPGWAALAQKAGHLAWLMAAAGAKGIAVDFESYGAAQFALDPAKGRTFEETEVLARRRGRSLVDAIAREQPGAVVLALWLNSVNLRAGACDDRVAALAASHYGLLPAFIDGMLDALPPTMILVDGCENGYYMDSAEEYLRAAHEIRSWSGAAIRLVSRENRPRYRGQVQCGFGFYLDMFLNEEGNRYYFPPLDGSRLARLERNLGFARDAADEYVWVYGEQCRWWGPPRDLPRTVGKGRLWEEAMPGITAAIAYARDPGEAARRELAARRDAGTLANLVRNPSFEGGAGKPDALDGVGRWQDERVPAGVLDWDAGVGGGAARARKVERGCFVIPVAVKSRETCAVEARCRAVGSSRPTIIVRWQTEDGRWTREPDDRTFGFREPEGDWSRAFGVVTVPDGAGKLVILLNVTGQLTDADVAWFDDVGVWRVRS